MAGPATRACHCNMKIFRNKRCAHVCTLVEVRGSVVNYSPVEPQSAWFQGTGRQLVAIVLFDCRLWQE
jgi:hypothetical protein